MSEPVIVMGEGIQKERLRMAINLIAAQVLAAAKLPLPAMKRQDRGPFNKSKEIERRRKQIEKTRGAV